jgi:anaerobic selenocysteine-containing dehydrogenase
VPDPGKFRLVTGNHLYFSGTLSRYSEILNELLQDPVVELSEADALDIGLKSGERVVVKGEHMSYLFILRTRKGTRSGVAFIAENYADTPVNRYFRRGDRLPLVSIEKA